MQYTGRALSRKKIVKRSKRLIAAVSRNPQDLFDDSHHRIPESRCIILRLNPNFEGNLMRIPQICHRAYHHLFGERIAEEAAEFLREKNWQPQNKTERVLIRLVCGDVYTLEERIAELERVWSIRNYNPYIWEQYILPLVS